MSKHTPGQWHSEDLQGPHGRTYWRIRETDAQANELIAQVGPWTRSRDGYEAACNARLIAAAPELYEALRGLLDWYAALPEPGLVSSPELSARLREARAALAKAEG